METFICLQKDNTEWQQHCYPVLKKKKDCGEWSTLAAIKARVQGCHLGTETRLIGKMRLGMKSRGQAASLGVTVKCRELMVAAAGTLLSSKTLCNA